MKHINFYLNFDGNAEEAFTFYSKVFKKPLNQLIRFEDSAFNTNIPQSEMHLIMHASLELIHNVQLMGTDALKSQGHSLVFGNNKRIAIDTDSKEEADTLFAELSEGGSVKLPMKDMPWGAYFGMFTDAFGVQWMLSYTKPIQPLKLEPDLQLI